LKRGQAPCWKDPAVPAKRGGINVETAERGRRVIPHGKKNNPWFLEKCFKGKDKHHRERKEEDPGAITPRKTARKKIPLPEEEGRIAKRKRKENRKRIERRNVSLKGMLARKGRSISKKLGIVRKGEGRLPYVTRVTESFEKEKEKGSHSEERGGGSHFL